MQRSLLAAQFDAATQLKDAGTAITANGVGQVSGVNQVVNVGTGFINPTWIVDVDLLTLGAGKIEIFLQGSTTPDFSAGVVNLSAISLGTASVTGNSADSVAGRFERLVLNSPDGVSRYPYLRVSHTVPNGSINYRSFLTKNTLAG